MTDKLITLLSFKNTAVLKISLKAILVPLPIFFVIFSSNKTWETVNGSQALLQNFKKAFFVIFFYLESCVFRLDRIVTHRTLPLSPKMVLFHFSPAGFLYIFVQLFVSLFFLPISFLVHMPKITTKIHKKFPENSASPSNSRFFWQIPRKFQSFVALLVQNRNLFHLRFCNSYT